MVLRAQQTITGLGREILGVVLNRVPKNAGADYAYYNKNYAYYGSRRAREKTAAGKTATGKTAAEKIAFVEKK
jgi:hypothetical protein